MINNIFFYLTAFPNAPQYIRKISGGTVHSHYDAVGDALRCNGGMHCNVVGFTLQRSRWCAVNGLVVASGPPRMKVIIIRLKRDFVKKKKLHCYDSHERYLHRSCHTF